MASAVLFYPFVEALAEERHNLASDVIKCALTNTAPDRTWATYSQILGEVANGNGYTTGGNTCTNVSSSQTGGVYTCVVADPATWTGSGAGFGPFRYLIWYNDSAPSKELICYADHGSAVTRLSGQTYTADIVSELVKIQVSA